MGESLNFKKPLVYKFSKLAVLVCASYRAKWEHECSRKSSAGGVLEDKNTKCCNIGKGPSDLASQISEENHTRQRTIHISYETTKKLSWWFKTANWILNNSGLVHMWLIAEPFSEKRISLLLEGTITIGMEFSCPYASHIAHDHAHTTHWMFHASVLIR